MRRRRLLSLFALVLAIPLCVFGALLDPASQPPLRLVLLWTLAAALLAAGAGLPEPTTAQPPGESLPPPFPWARGATFLGCLLGGVFLVFSLARFGASDSVSRSGWMLFVLALFLATLSFVPWKGLRTGREEKVERWELAGLAFLLVVAAVFRLHRLWTEPYGIWADEAENLLVTLRILDDPLYRPVFVAEASKMPALAFYVFAPFVKVLGGTALALRIATTVVGLLSVVATWLLGRELFGRRVALIAAALLAVSRWHVSFSRFGMAILFPTLFVPLVLFLYMRSQRLRSPRDAALAGASLGLGVQLYYSTVTLPAVIVLTFLREALGPRKKRLATATALLVVTIGIAVFVYAPVWQFARRHPEHFAERFRAVSSLRVDSLEQLLRLFLRPSPERREAVDVLSTSFVRHAQMFHFRGDANGRHNLPGAPMLDSVSGFFFAVGLLWCVAALRQPRSLLLLLWFASSMAAGILSVDFEAPQAARTLGVTPALSLMAALPLSRIWRGVEGDEQWWRKLAGPGLVTFFLAVAGWRAWDVYFHKQLSDPGAWASWSTPETKIAEVILKEGQRAAFFVPPTMIASPTIRLLVGGPNPARPFDISRDLPLETGGERAIVFLGQEEGGTQILLQNLYPHATLEFFGPPVRPASPADSVLRIVSIPARDIEELRGWTTELEAPGLKEEPRNTPQAFWNWAALGVRPPFTAHVRGRLKVGRCGNYRLVLSSAAAATLAVDGGSVLSGAGRREASLQLAEGIHDLVLDVNVMATSDRTELTWATSVSSQEGPIPLSAMYSPRFPFGGLLGSYYTGKSWEGAPVFQRIDPGVAFYFHLVPLERPFSIRWTGMIEAPEEGVYTFSTRSIDESFVSVDGMEILRNPGALQETEGTLTLSRGRHAFEVRLWNTSDFAQIFLSWIRPGHERETVPAEVLRPSPPAPRPEGRVVPRRKRS